MKAQVTALIKQAIESLQQQGKLDEACQYEIRLDRSKYPSHGDFACNVALALAKSARQKPRDLAQQIVAHLPPSDHLIKVDIAGPGFINFFFEPSKPL